MSRSKLVGGISTVYLPQFLLGLMLTVLLAVVPVYAETLTLNFTGTVDLSLFGGPVSSTFGGFVSLGSVFPAAPHGPSWTQPV